MWHSNEQAQREYQGCQDDWQAVAQIAAQCSEFRPDDEDEQVADEPVSCYNCRFRRWTRSSFVCLNELGYRGNAPVE